MLPHSSQDDHAVTPGCQRATVGWWWTEAKLDLRNPQPLPHGDQFDRIITATHHLVLLTKDANITDSGSVATL
jgi:hypothetical protein